MHRQPVQSSNLKSVGYDPATRTLEIEFHDGDVYLYYNVPPVVHRDLLAASSVGQYFDYFIKPTYRFRKMP
jgi:hypothetical protein